MLRACLLIAVVALVQGTTWAQGLVQLSLHGKISDPGGARVEVEIGAWAVASADAQPTPRELDFNAHLAAGTTGQELAQLLERRFSRAGFDVFATEPREGRGQLFIERALFVRLRLCSGLACEITLADRAPRSVRIMPPTYDKSDATFAFTATTYHPHTELRGRASFDLTIDSGLIPAQVSERLFEVAVDKGWMSQRPGIDAWQPLKRADGALLQGCSMSLRSSSDWRLEVELER